MHQAQYCLHTQYYNVVVETVNMQYGGGHSEHAIWWCTQCLKLFCLKAYSIFKYIDINLLKNEHKLHYNIEFILTKR